MTGSVPVAAAQFPVSGDVIENKDHIRHALEAAAQAGAKVVVTPETGLCGYCGHDLASLDGYDWNALWAATEELCAVTREQGLWLVLGSMHHLGGETAPTNCLYVIDPRGVIVDRYDKRFLTGYRSAEEVDVLDRGRDPAGGFPTGDLRFYSAGDHFVTFDVDGVRFGLAVCYDLCWPQIYAAYRELGVDVMLHAFHNVLARQTCLTFLTEREAPTRCADNRMWALCVNSSGPGSQWGSFFARPDASISARIEATSAGVLVRTVPDGLSEGGWLHTFRGLSVAAGEMMQRGERPATARRLDGTSPARPARSE